MSLSRCLAWLPWRRACSCSTAKSRKCPHPISYFPMPRKRQLKRDNSPLLRREPPGGKVSGEALLWWHIVRQAAYDLRFGPESVARDALEFLRTTGDYVCVTLFDFHTSEYQHEVAGLVARRNRFHREPLSLASISRV